MSCNLNLQRNTKVFLSTIDLLAAGAAASDMTPSNTWQIEVLAGYAMSQATSVEDITALESGSTPDRSTTRFQTSINPVDWSFQVYIRPTGLETTTEDASNTSAVIANSRPVADWYLWQALFSNAALASSVSSRSAWQEGGRFETAVRTASANVSAHSPNFGSAQENYLYMKLDNVIYQVGAASVNEASVDAPIDGIASTTWTGFGTTLKELTGTDRNNAVSVFGGTDNSGTTVTANSNHLACETTQAYHPWDTYNVAGTAATASFIKNRLSTINMYHQTEAGSTTNYTFPVTALSWTWNNNITYLTPEELNSLNSPIGNFAGSRLISGSVTAYLRHGTDQSAALLKNILEDTRVSHSAYANANISVGGATAPYMAFYMPATQFSLPVHNIEDVITVTADFQAQEPSDSCGQGGEVQVFVKKS